MSAAGVDEDVARAVNDGRRTIGALVAAAQRQLQVVFVVFAVGLIAGIMAMRFVVWPQLKADLLARGAGAEVIAQTPFDVILLQVKIGMIVGILTALPVLLYYARDPLVERGVLPDVSVSRWKAVLVGIVATGLFLGGAVYAYTLFFPIMFSFLATNAAGAGLAPTYSIVAWTQFIFVLGLSFGLAAQLPLVMVALAYSGVVPYEVWRDKWKYAVVLMFAFGAIFSPPDPFTQLMWATPLLALYGISLYLTKIVVTAKRGRESFDARAALRARWNLIAGAAVVGFGTAYGFFQFGASALERTAGVTVPAPDAILGLGPTTSLVALSVGVGVAVGLVTALWAIVNSLGSVTPGPGSPANPAAIDLTELDAAGVRSAPPEAFQALSEQEALQLARDAMDADEPETAQAILDRFEAAQEAEEGEPSGEGGAEATDEGGDVVTRTTAGVLDAFTEDTTTEDDIGGYYHDIAFILSSLRSRAFRIVAVFVLVLGGIFGYLYSGGIGAIRDDFITRIPPDARPAGASNWPITLHPVEALAFEAKISALLAGIAVLPMIVYYAWPALEERGLVTGDRRTILTWAGSIVVALVGGSVLGYLYVAPEVISWLVYDALRENMVIAYRVSNFFWLVFLTTSGIGLLFDIPVSMLLFHRGGIVSYASMYRRWRAFAIGSFFLAALLTPDSIWTMFLVAIPVILFYGLGLGLLWVYTAGGRR